MEELQVQANITSDIEIISRSYQTRKDAHTV